jgi:hemin uptake protein HemP
MTAHSHEYSHLLKVNSKASRVIMDTERDDTRSQTAQSAATVPTWDVDRLTNGGREALIRHEGQLYRLRITINRKLILTK